MGNVVSSLLMYAIQAAWFCQRLIDQDYRQNHGSRSKPIMDIDETDLDMFLSKCRSYYMSKGKGNSQIKWEATPETERTGRKWTYHRVRSCAENTKTNSNSHFACNKSGTHALFPTCLDFDSENFLSRMDQELASRQTDFARLVMNKNDLDRFLAKSGDTSPSRGIANVFQKSDSPKTERWKRKKMYYRKRYNPESGPCRPVEATYSPCEASHLVETNPVLKIDSEPIESMSRDDYLNFDNEDSISGKNEREKRLVSPCFAGMLYMQRTSNSNEQWERGGGGGGGGGGGVKIDLKFVSENLHRPETEINKPRFDHNFELLSDSSRRSALGGTPELYDRPPAKPESIHLRREVTETVDEDLVLVIKEVEINMMGEEMVEILYGLNEKSPKILMAQDCLNENSNF